MISIKFIKDKFLPSKKKDINKDTIATLLSEHAVRSFPYILLEIENDIKSEKYIDTLKALFAYGVITSEPELCELIYPMCPSDAVFISVFNDVFPYYDKLYDAKVMLEFIKFSYGKDSVFLDLCQPKIEGVKNLNQEKYLKQCSRDLVDSISDYVLSQHPRKQEFIPRD